MLAVAGLPPASGLWPKVLLVKASLDAGVWWLALGHFLASGLPDHTGARTRPLRSPSGATCQKAPDRVTHRFRQPMTGYALTRRAADTHPGDRDLLPSHHPAGRTWRRKGCLAPSGFVEAVFPEEAAAPDAVQGEPEIEEGTE